MSDVIDDADAWAFDRMFIDEDVPVQPRFAGDDTAGPQDLDRDPLPEPPHDPIDPTPDPGPVGRPAESTPNPQVVDPAAPAPQAAPESEPRTDRSATRVAAALGVGLALAVAAIVTAVVVLSDSTPAAPPPAARPAPVAPVTPAPPTSALPTPDQDQVVPFTAAASCPAGSTSAQSLTDTGSDAVWVCVRGPQGAQVDGQVLHVAFDRSYVLSAVSVTPGWVAKTPQGPDEWLQHRVVTRLQYIFNDNDRTVFTQDTGNTHGPVTTPLPHKVLASQVTVIVLQTHRPPASPLPSAGQGGAPEQPAAGDSLLGAGGVPPPPDTQQFVSQPDPGDPAAADPVDSTFAMSALKFFGHQPN